MCNWIFSNFKLYWFQFEIIFDPLWNCICSNMKLDLFHWTHGIDLDSWYKLRSKALAEGQTRIGDWGNRVGLLNPDCLEERESLEDWKDGLVQAFPFLHASKAEKPWPIPVLNVLCFFVCCVWQQISVLLFIFFAVYFSRCFFNVLCCSICCISQLVLVFYCLMFFLFCGWQQVSVFDVSVNIFPMCCSSLWCYMCLVSPFAVYCSQFQWFKFSVSLFAEIGIKFQSSKFSVYLFAGCFRRFWYCMSFVALFALCCCQFQCCMFSLSLFAVCGSRFYCFCHQFLYLLCLAACPLVL